MTIFKNEIKKDVTNFLMFLYIFDKDSYVALNKNQEIIKN